MPSIKTFITTASNEGPSTMSTMVVVLILSMVASAQGQYCAFEVTVRLPDGRPAASVTVSGLDQPGRVFATSMTNDQGVVRICDIPTGLIDIHVGGNLAGAVSVMRLKPFWMETRKVLVTYENRPETAFFLPGGCLLTLRAHDEKGAPIAGVLLEDSNERPKLREQTRTTDSYGRMFRFIDYGEALTGELVKAGYVSKRVTHQCQRGVDAEREQIVVLQRRSDNVHEQ